MTNRLRLLSFGAGAIGTYVGGSLALHGHAVTFLERPEVAAGLRQSGLRLRLGETEHTLPNPSLAASLAEALEQGPFDVALFALKSYDTQAALADLIPFAASLPPVLSVQNGVDNEPAIAAALGPGKAIAGTLTSAIGRKAAGDAVLERLRGAGIAGGHPLSEALVAALNEAGLNARLYASAADMKWSKMLTNLLSNATSAILNLTPAEVFAHPGLFRLELAQLREVLRVMDKRGYRVVDLPGTPVRLLAAAVRYLPGAVSRPFMQKAVGGGRGGKMPSFHIDLHGGRGQSEVAFLNGAVVRYGAESGVPTPANKLLTETLLALTKGEIPLAEYDHQPEKLLGGLDKYPPFR